jgi:hypothetical protein
VPDFRATVRANRVRLVDWAPWLAGSGPLQTMLHARGRAGFGIADLTVLRDEDVADEVIVEFVAGDAPAHREALTQWAAAVGYRRAWLPGDLRELEPNVGGIAATTCTGCRVRLVDGDPRFWLMVRRGGRFPAACPLCGCDLPQWTTMSDRGPAERPVHRGEARRGEAEAVRRVP